MNLFSIAFITPSNIPGLCHSIIKAETEEAAMKKFFNAHASSFYSDDDKGFYYFKEDFYDTGAGNIIRIDKNEVL